MSALTAIKYNPHIEALYQRLLSQGKNKMCAFRCCNAQAYTSVLWRFKTSDCLSKRLFIGRIISKPD